MLNNPKLKYNSFSSLADISFTLTFVRYPCRIEFIRALAARGIYYIYSERFKCGR